MINHDKHNLKYPLLLIVILFLALGTGFAGRCLWWTWGASGNSAENRGGNILGQTAVGNADHPGITDGTYGFWDYIFDREYICFEIDPERYYNHRVQWYIDSTMADTLAPDSIVWSDDFYVSTSTYTSRIEMKDGEQIPISNCGNCHLGFGFQFIRCLPADFTAGMSATASRLIIRALFTDPETIPDASDFKPLDYVPTGTIRWGDGNRYGSRSFDIATYEQVDLWLQFTSPKASRENRGEYTIKIAVVAKAYLP